MHGTAVDSVSWSFRITLIPVEDENMPLLHVISKLKIKILGISNTIEKDAFKGSMTHLQKLWGLEKEIKSL